MIHARAARFRPPIWALASVALSCAATLSSTGARADVVGPEPLPIACPPGGISSVQNWMSHGQRAYCAPYLAPATGPCFERHRRQILELSIAGIAPSIGGHYGGPPIVATDENTLARLEGPCDASDDEVPAELGAASTAFGAFQGPNVAEAPIGCHRMWVWVDDASVHCPVEPPLAPVPVTPALPSLPVVGPPEPTAAASPAPIAEESSPTPSTRSTPSTPTESVPGATGSSCACSLARSSASVSATRVFTLAFAWAWARVAMSFLRRAGRKEVLRV